MNMNYCIYEHSNTQHLSYILLIHEANTCNLYVYHLTNIYIRWIY